MSHSLLELIGSNQVFFDQDFAEPGRHSKSPWGGARLKLEGSRRNRGVLRPRDRKSTRLNSSHANISYAVFCLKKKKKKQIKQNEHTKTIRHTAQCIPNR